MKRLYQNPTGDMVENPPKAEELADDDLKDVDECIDESLHSNDKSHVITAPNVDNKQ